MNKDEEQRDEEELSFAEIYGEVLLNQNFSILLREEDVERCKAGLKNYKSYQARRAKAEGLPVDFNVLAFKERPYACETGFIELSISLEKRATVMVKRVKQIDLNGDLDDE